MNVPRWGQRLGGPLGWADVPTYVSAASPRLPPRSRPLPPLAPPGLSGALQASGCVGPGRPRRGTWVSVASAQLSVINPASASSPDCVDTAGPRSAQPRRPALVGSCPCAPFPATGSEARPAGPRVPAPPASRPPEAPSLTCCLTHSPPRPLPPLGPAGGRGRARGESLTWQPGSRGRIGACAENTEAAGVAPAGRGDPGRDARDVVAELGVPFGPRYRVPRGGQPSRRFVSGWSVLLLGEEAPPNLVPPQPRVPRPRVPRPQVPPTPSPCCRPGITHSHRLPAARPPRPGPEGLQGGPRVLPLINFALNN